MAKVMIVDDNKDIVDTLKEIMEIEGYETDVAYNGEEFLNKVEKTNPDIVLLDVMMPGLKTKDILSELKEKNLNPKVMLVTVVRFSEEERKFLMEEFNIVDYIAKPFDVLDIIIRVRKVLS